MDIGNGQFNEIVGSSKKSFFSHVFSNTEDGKAEILNVIQYALMGIIPIVVLNKTIQRFIPDADIDKSSLELLSEIFIQIIVMFCGIIIVHRIITYFPTYSGFKYDNLILTNVILAFLMVILSIQTKLGLKVNILFDNVMELWNGTTGGGSSIKENVKKGVRVNSTISTHSPSQADYLDNSMVQTNIFPPAPVATNKPDSHNHMMPQSGLATGGDYGIMQPMAANSLLGGSFGAAF
jgi:hypothetical protein